MRPPYLIRIALASLVVATFVLAVGWSWWKAVIVLVGPEATVLALSRLPRRDDTPDVRPSADGGCSAWKGALRVGGSWLLRRGR
jgi:hypothetical protein